jgi:hypothetical protein
MQALTGVGTDVLVRGPGAMDPAALMSAKAVPGALALADEQAKADAAAIGEFWI